MQWQPEGFTTTRFGSTGGRSVLTAPFAGVGLLAAPADSRALFAASRTAAAAATTIASEEAGTGAMLGDDAPERIAVTCAGSRGAAAALRAATTTPICAIDGALLKGLSTGAGVGDIDLAGNTGDPLATAAALAAACAALATAWSAANTAASRAAAAASSESSSLVLSMLGIGLATGFKGAALTFIACETG